MSDSDTTSDAFKEYAGKWFQALVRGTAGVYGGKAQDAVSLKPDEELRLWLKPTSAAAQKAYELAAQKGLTADEADDEARKANALWAHAMRGQQIQITQQAQQAGATPDQIHEILKGQGLTDEMIFATCRRDAFNLGKQNGQNDPKVETAYHKRMAEKAAAQQAPDVTYQTVEPEQEVSSGVRSV